MSHAPPTPTRPPTIDQVRGALAYFNVPRLERFARARDCFDAFTRNEDIALDVLRENAEASVAAADLEAAIEDRVERDMLESLCESCNAEIPDDSNYGCDTENAVYFCEECHLDLVASHRAEGAKLAPLSLEWCLHFGRPVDSREELDEHEMLVEVEGRSATTNELLESHVLAIPVERYLAAAELPATENEVRLQVQVGDPEGTADAA